MIIRRKVIVGAGQAILILLALAACNLILPFETRSAQVVFKLEMPLWRCLPASVGTFKYVIDPSLATQFKWNQKLATGQAAYMDRNWEIKSIDNLAAWAGADLVSTNYDAAKSPSTLNVELVSGVGAVYLAVDHDLFQKSAKPPMWLTDNYVRMTRLDDPSKPQEIEISRPNTLYLEIWRYKYDPGDPKWPGSQNGHPLWSVPPLPPHVPTGVEPSNFLAIIQPSSGYDCSAKSHAAADPVDTWKDTEGPYDADTPENRQKAIAAAQSKVKDWIQAEASKYPDGPLSPGDITIVGTDQVQSKQDTLKQFDFGFEPWAFPVESVIRYDPAKFASTATVTFQKKSYTSKVRGTLFFHYLLDSNGLVPVLNLEDLRMDLDPIATDVGKFHDVSVMMLAQTDAVSHDKILPWHRPADHYSIPALGLVTSLSTRRNGDLIVLTARNRQNIDLTIDQNTRSFKFQGGPLATSITLDGKEEPVEVSVDLTGFFENFAPQARTMESKTISECGEDDTNISPFYLDSAGSFTLYSDPLPSNPAAYSWFENFGGMTEQLWGNGKKLVIPPHKLRYGVHPFTLLLRDNHGLVDTSKLNLIVQDTHPPVLNIPPDVVRVVRLPGVSPVKRVKIDVGKAFAYDSSQPHVDISNDAPQNLMFPEGMTNVTWTADDGHGNVTQKVQHVTVLGLPNPPADRESVRRAVKAVKKAVQLGGLLQGSQAANPNTAAELASLHAAVQALRESIGAIAVPDNVQTARTDVLRELDDLVSTMKEEQEAITKANAALDQVGKTGQATLRALTHADETLGRAP